MLFDFGTDEEKAQQARHKLDVWKQAFRLDKKVLYKFEREELAETEEPAQEKGGKSGKAGKSKAKKDGDQEKAGGNVKLHLRLAFSGHEKLTEQRWVDRIPSEEPFKESSPKTIGPNDAGFGKAQERFEALD